MNVIDDLLEATCKNMIKTILFCLEHATKATIYRIGTMPELRAVRITSGIRKEGTDEIQWGLPLSSDYNYPGKRWEQYRDQPGRVLEAMGWCVEKELSWTADNPYEDVRSVRKQLRGETEGFYHMEPVLVRKVDLYGNSLLQNDYPLDYKGNPIWQDTEYVVAAVIKIHFLSNTLRRGDRSTKVIKELSFTLGTELLSLYLRESLAHAQREFTRQRLQSCEILAHELRNTLVRFASIFSAVNAQIGMLREEWEAQLRRVLPDLEWKGAILSRLDELIHARLPALGGDSGLTPLCNTLLAEQEELASLALLPQQSEKWLMNKIRPKWERLLSESRLWDSDREEVRQLLDRLEKALLIGLETEVVAKVTHLPKDLTENWARLAYVYYTSDNLALLEQVLQLLDNPLLPVPQKHQIKKTLKSLKSLLEIATQIEETTNRIIVALRFGGLTGAGAVEDLEPVSRALLAIEGQGDEKAAAVE